MTDDLGRLTNLRDSDPDIQLVCHTIVARNDCTSRAHLMDARPDVFDELLQLAEAMAGLDP